MFLSDNIDVSSPSYYYPFIILFFILFSCVQILIWAYKKDEEMDLCEVDECEKFMLNDILHERGKYLQFIYMSAFLLTKASMWAKAPYTFMLFSAYYGFSVGQIGVLYLIDACCSLVSGPLIGILADTFGRRMVALIYPFNTVVVLLMRMSGSVPLAYTAQIFTGFAGNILSTSFEAWLNCEISIVYGNLKTYIHHFRKQIFSKILFWDSILSLLVTTIGALIYVRIYLIRLTLEFLLRSAFLFS